MRLVVREADPIAPPSYIRRLSTGYWHVRFGPYRYLQWPVGQLPRLDDCHGYGLDERHVEAAEAATRGR